MQMWQVLAVVLEIIVLTSGAAYYKVRPPPPNNPHLHYGPKPPGHFHSKPPGHFYGPPRRPVQFHAPRNPIRPPPRPFISKPTPPPPPPFAPASWKSPQSSFHAPVVKETFHSSPLSYTPDITQSYIRDDEKGPIHTIPAPNLSAADRPSHDYSQTHVQEYTQEHSQGHANHGLEAILRHGVQAVQATPVSSYQVTEDPSAYKPYSGTSSYFAPDPDPSLPTIEVPKTLDPHSIPSNGQQPLDLYQQQLEESQQQDQPLAVVQPAYTGGTGNTLSPQELYTLLHGGGEQMTPELYQQYLQAAAAQQPAVYQQVYNAGLLFAQQQQQAAQFAQQNFHPQYETFNYNEQTQEGAYGSDSFPSASSISVGVKRAVSKDTAIVGDNKIPTDQKGTFLGKGQAEDSSEVGVISNQVDYDEEQSSEESKEIKEAGNIVNTGYYASLPDKQTTETLATLAAAGNINNQIMKSPNIISENKKQDINYENRQQSETTEVRNHENKHLNPQGVNEIKEQQTLINQEIRKNQGKQMEQTVQLYVQHEMNKAQDTNNDQRLQGYRNSLIRTTENEKNQQLPANHNPRDHQSTQVKHSQNNDEKKEQSSEVESDYSEDEILDPSDKDLRGKGIHMQNSMGNLYSYYRNINDAREKEGQTEEQSYEDMDYSQEDEKGTNISDSPSNLSITTEKSINYNAHQNHLPFGAKLRPKRV